MNPLTEKLREGLVCLVPNPGVEMPSCHENTICDCTVLKLLDVIDVQHKVLEFYATAPCDPRILDIAGRFREPALDGLIKSDALLKEIV